jgi:hypothetical protein
VGDLLGGLNISGGRRSFSTAELSREPYRQSLLGISLGAPASNQLDDEENHRNHQDQVNQPAADLQRKTKQPENYENYQNCPEHSFFLSLRAIDYGMRSPRMIS